MGISIMPDEQIAALERRPRAISQLVGVDRGDAFGVADERIRRPGPVADAQAGAAALVGPPGAADALDFEDIERAARRPPRRAQRRRPCRGAPAERGPVRLPGPNCAVRRRIRGGALRRPPPEDVDDRAGANDSRVHCWGTNWPACASRSRQVERTAEALGREVPADERAPPPTGAAAIAVADNPMAAGASCLWTAPMLAMPTHRCSSRSMPRRRGTMPKMPPISAGR